jgi:hypothetical protein
MAPVDETKYIEWHRHLSEAMSELMKDFMATHPGNPESERRRGAARIEHAAALVIDVVARYEDVR